MNKASKSLPAAFLVSTLVAPSAYAGHTFKMRNETNGAVMSVAQVLVEGDAAKAEYLEVSGDNPMFAVGSYMLINEQGMFFVNPKERSYMRFDPAMMEQMTASFGASGMGDAFQITDVQAEKTLDEPGEPIESYATRHYQFKSSWTMSMRGMPGGTEQNTVEDVWTTEQLDVGSALSQMTMDTSAIPEGVRQAAAAQVFETTGVPLRRVTVQTTKINMPGLGALGALGGLGARMARGGRGGRGGGDNEPGAAAGAGGNSTTTTVTISDIEERAIAADTFALPAGYRETQMFQSGPALPSLNDIPADGGGAGGVPRLNDLN